LSYYMNVNINKNLIQKFSKQFRENDKNILSRNVCTSNNIDSLCLNREEIQKRNHVFSNRINNGKADKYKASNQKSSGRCWIFAFLNMLRIPMIKKYNLEDNFEFSHNYIYFWDRFEKANYFLHKINETKKLEIDDRLVKFFMADPTGDGGQWNMLQNIVNKYGIIPKRCMNETINSNNTHNFESFLNDKLRQYAMEIRNGSDNFEKYLYEIYTILVIFLGEPPQQFTWEYYSTKETTKTTLSSKNKSTEKSSIGSMRGTKKTNKNKVKKGGIYQRISEITPLNFYTKYVPVDVNDYICLINDPRNTYYKKYCVEYLNNVSNGGGTDYINVPTSVMKSMVKDSIIENESVWFGSDVGKHSHTKLGILDDRSINYSLIFDFDVQPDKKTALESGTSYVTHAMLIKGFNFENEKKDKINKWLVENSWGKENGDNGNFVMSDTWFDKFVYEAVINKKILNKTTEGQKIIKIYDSKDMVTLKPWDPFGSLLL
jgi:bleomycin hydrolase